MNKNHQEWFKREVQFIRSHRLQSEIVGKTPVRITWRKLSSASMDTLALWYCAAQAEMETYDSWSRARTLSNRLTRIEQFIEDTLGKQCL